ncbi:hypothetical protein BYT27DRAFT_7259074 [Phlegmacium glaucopus]|nr:hypothetical protein BYT27DRAFT_7259074 [Phlegmacium glaucopus]
MSDSLTIPKLKHIPLLEGTANALGWFRSMTQTLKAEGFVSFPLTALSTNAQQQAASTWWIKDSRVLSIIDCCLNPVTQSLMPVGNDITSRIVWNKLKSMYSHVNVHAQFDLHGRLTDNTLQNASDYIHFLGEFNTCHSHLATMDAPLTKSISHFVQTWSEIEATCDYPSPPNTLYTKVITHLKQECLMLQAHAKPGPGTEYANLATIKKTSYQ